MIHNRRLSVISIMTGLAVSAVLITMVLAHQHGTSSDLSTAALLLPFAIGLGIARLLEIKPHRRQSEPD